MEALEPAKKGRKEEEQQVARSRQHKSNIYIYIIIKIKTGKIEEHDLAQNTC